MANFLSSLSNLVNLSALFSPKKKGSVLGIDIGSSSIKVVQLTEKNGHAVLETYGELSLGPYADKNIGQAVNLSNDKIVEAILDILKEKEVNITTHVCGLAIPFSSSLITVMELPALPKEQLDQMVPLEARRYIPVPISEVTLDWYVIPRNEDKSEQPETDMMGNPVAKRAEVILVALHNDTLIKYKDIVNRSLLEASFFEIEIFSTMRAVLDQEIEPVLIIDLGATTTKLYVVERGVLTSSHIVTRGSQNITDELSRSLSIPIDEAEMVKREKGLSVINDDPRVKNVITLTLNYIFSEANKVVMSHHKRYNKNINKVVLVGGGSALKGIIPVAKSNFQIEVLVGDPFAKVVAPAFLEKVLRDTGAQFAVAIGVALRRLKELN